MIVFRKKDELNAKISSLKEENTTVGFVPTMGALHQGHLSLVEEALANNNLVVVSIFVNPTQFDNSEDLKKYPRNLQQDVDLLNTLSDKIIVYAPTVEDIYEGETKSRKFNFDGLEHQMEGKFRDGHFDGVGTIVKLLFDIVKPNNAYFGEKDFQQLAIIKKLVSKYNMPVNIVGCKIKRDANGLALSSRNTRLKPEHKVVAPFIYKTLKAAKDKFGTKSANKVIEWVVNQFANHELLELEYFTIADEATLKTVKRKSKNKQYRAFIAVYAGKIRLIDNIALN
ncbi:pantoate--beta-alanine ligase [Mesoflavibacter zeaxanthinifaciens]|uniref:pantoate--beta-alanine ligase n=1 Tax=Mesoflavibacter zeaxanthinifaciens TaxID=393060 RepID=UPI003A94AC22